MFTCELTLNLHDIYRKKYYLLIKFWLEKSACYTRDITEIVFMKGDKYSQNKVKFILLDTIFSLVKSCLTQFALHFGTKITITCHVRQWFA